MGIFRIRRCQFACGVALKGGAIFVFVWRVLTWHLAFSFRFYVLAEIAVDHAPRTTHGGGWNLNRHPFH